MNSEEPSHLDLSSLDRHVRDVLREEPLDTAGIERNVMRHIAREGQRRWLAVIAMAAALLCVLFVGYRQTLKPVAAILMDAARDHRLEVMESQPRRWRSDPADIEAVAARFGIDGRKAAALAPSGFRLLHAKTCGLEGRPVLHLVFTDGTRQVSIYVRAGRGDSHAATAETGTERVASVETAAYTAVVVTADAAIDCEKIARRAASVL